jgi:hypothetical protein
MWNRKNQELTAQLNAQVSANEWLRTTSERSQAELKDVQGQYRTEIRKLNDQATRMQQAILQLQEEKTVLVDENNQLRHEKDNFENRLDTLRVELGNNHANELNSLREEYSGLYNTAVNSVRQEHQMAINEKDTQIQECEQKMQTDRTEFEREINNRSDTERILKAEYQNLDATRQKLTNEVQLLRGELKDAVGNKSATESEHMKLRGEIKRIQEECQKEKERLGHLVKNHYKDKLELNQQINSLNKTKHEQNILLRQCQDENLRLEREFINNLNAVKQDDKEKTATIDNLRVANEGLVQRVAVLNDSLSRSREHSALVSGESVNRTKIVYDAYDTVLSSIQSAWDSMNTLRDRRVHELATSLIRERTDRQQRDVDSVCWEETVNRLKIALDTEQSWSSIRGERLRSLVKREARHGLPVGSVDGTNRRLTKLLDWYPAVADAYVDNIQTKAHLLSHCFYGRYKRLESEFVRLHEENGRSACERDADRGWMDIRDDWNATRFARCETSTVLTARMHEWLYSVVDGYHAWLDGGCAAFVESVRGQNSAVYQRFTVLTQKLDEMRFRCEKCVMERTALVRRDTTNTQQLKNCTIQLAVKDIKIALQAEENRKNEAEIKRLKWIESFFTTDLQEVYEKHSVCRSQLERLKRETLHGSQCFAIEQAEQNERATIFHTEISERTEKVLRLKCAEPSRKRKQPPTGNEKAKRLKLRRRVIGLRQELQHNIVETGVLVEKLRRSQIASTFQCDRRIFCCTEGERRIAIATAADASFAHLTACKDTAARSVAPRRSVATDTDRAEKPLPSRPPPSVVRVDRLIWRAAAPTLVRM